MPCCRWRPHTEQLARAYAAACIVDRISHDGSLARRFKDYSNHWAAKLEKPPALMLYTNMMFGLSAMQEQIVKLPAGTTAWKILARRGPMRSMPQMHS